MCTAYRSLAYVASPKATFTHSSAAERVASSR